MGLVPARADLTAVVTPGYQFPTDGSVAPTFDLLNLLGMPTIQILGTISGSNTLAPGSVTGVSLSDNLPDGVTVVWNGNSPRQLQVAGSGLVNGTNGIGANAGNQFYLVLDTNYFHLQTNTIFGAGTNNTGSSTTFWLSLAALSLGDTNVATNAAIQPGKIVLPANSLGWGNTNAAGTNVPMGGLILGPEFVISPATNSGPAWTNSGAGLRVRLFTSAETSIIGSGLLLDTAHSLGYRPPHLRAVLVCKTAEGGYAVGDEIELSQVGVGGTGGSFNYGANGTNVFVVEQNTGNALGFWNKSSGNGFNITFGNWRAKVYAW